MRTDCTRDTKPVKCTHLASGPLLKKWEAEPGDFISYREYYNNDDNFHYRSGRVIGAVTATPLPNDDPEWGTERMIEIVAFSEGLGFGYVRWIKPQDVYELVHATKALKFLEKVTRPEPPTIDAEGWPI